MKTLLKWILCVLILTSCQQKNKMVMLDPKVTLEFYSITTCSECEVFKKKAIPYLQKRFGESIDIAMYDMDDKEVTSRYDAVIDALKDFDEEYYGHGPFIVVKNEFALLGYHTGDEKLLAEDIIAYQNGTALSSELALIRYDYKQTSKEE